jgi:hypothetical protein
MKIEMTNYLKIFHVPSYQFVKNDRRNKKLYVQPFSSELIFKRSMETLRFSLKNKSINNRKTGKSREIQRILGDMSLNFNYSSDFISLMPKTIFWDEDQKLGFFEVVSKNII